MPLSDRIKEAMDSASLSAADLARATKRTPGAVTQWLDGTTKSLKADTANMIEVATGYRSAWLVTGKGPKKIQADFASIDGGKTLFDAEPGAEEMGNAPAARPVAVVGMARLGDNGYYEEISSIPGAGDGYVMGYYTSDSSAYCLQVRGDSMFPAIKNGWFIVVEPNTRLAQGEYVVLKLHNGKKMVKELLYERPDSLTVVSVNGGIQQTIMREDLQDAQAVGTILPPSKWKPV